VQTAPRRCADYLNDIGVCGAIGPLLGMVDPSRRRDGTRALSYFARGSPLEASDPRRQTLGLASLGRPFDFAQGRLLRPSLHKLLQNVTEILPVSAQFHSVTAGS
jgi:hypothetical protein